MVDSAGPNSGRAAALGAQLSAFRKRALLTQEQLAHRSGVSVRTIRQLEAGRVGRPRSESLRRLADALGLAEPERVALVADGAGAIPSAPVLPAPGCQLPVDVGGFTGRDDSLAQLDGLLSDGSGHPAAVVISAIGGTAGVGKTALAVHWAHGVREQFPDGQLYVNLQGYAPGPPLSPMQALARLLDALGMEPDQVPVETEAAAGLYRSLLTDRRVLIVLDNASNAEQVRQLVPASSGCMVVVTSRDRLGGLVATHGAHRLSLDVLSPAEAVVLLGRILDDDRVARAPEAAAELARICGYLPLAVRIAAANLACQPRQSIAGYVSRLREGDRLGELAVVGDWEAAVRVAFDCSYAALDVDGQRLFRLLGLIPGPEFTAPAAAALSGMPLAQADHMLERLSAAHLVEPRALGRFGFHDLLRLYARQRTQHKDGAQERQEATERLLAWYLHGTDAAARLLYPEKTRLPLPPLGIEPPQASFADHTQALAWLDAERPSLVAAVQHAAADGPRPAAWLIADTLRGYFVLRRFPTEWLAIARAGLAAAEADDQPSAQAAAHLSLADLHVVQSQHEQSTRDYLCALTLARQAGWLQGEAAVLGNLGMVYQQSGRLEEAREHHIRALALDGQTGCLAGQAINLGNLGIVSWLMGQLEQAADYNRRALALYRETGSSYGEALTLSNLGMAYHALGRLDDALEHLSPALALQREIGDRGNESDTLQSLAAVHRDAGRYRRALELAEAALALARDTGDRVIEAEAVHVLGTVHLSLGDHQLAAANNQEALRLAVEAYEGYSEVGARIGLAHVHQHLGRPDQALACAWQALTRARRAGYRLLEGQALTSLADSRLILDQPGRAIRHARRALAIHRHTGHRLGQARTLLVLGRALSHTQGADAARPHWRQALALFADIGAPEADQVRTLLRPSRQVRRPD